MWLGLPPAIVKAVEPELTGDQRRLEIESFDYVWKTVREVHWEPERVGAPWQAAREELRPKVEKARTHSEARAVLQDLLARLKQSHFSIIPEDTYRHLENKPAGAGESRPAARNAGGEGRSGMDVRVVDGEALVVSLDPEGGAAAAGVRLGWRVLRIDGLDMDMVAREIEAAYRNSTLVELVLARAFQQKLSGDPGERAKVEFAEGGGAKVEKEIVLKTPRGTPARFGHLPPQRVWFESRRLEPDAGYIAFNMFLDPARLMPAFGDAVASFRKTAGLVIDLRGNPGGIGIMATGMAGWFVAKEDLRLGVMNLRGTPVKFAVNPRFPTYTQPVAILIDGASASTSEIFAGGMKDIGRARIFGTRSAGAALPSIIERLPNGDGFQYATASYVSDGGKPLEGAGVLPDVEVRHSRAALLAGRDEVVEAAVHWIRSQRKPE